MPRAGVLDPQGEAVARALASLGFAGVEGARQGKVIELALSEGGEAEVRRMCEALLVNAVIEDYRVEMTGDGEGAGPGAAASGAAVSEAAVSEADGGE